MSNKTLDIKEIWKKIPHRYPFLLIDRVTNVTDTYIEAYKNVSANDQFFCGHFPDEPIMPGVLICEAAAQAGAIFLKHSPLFEDKLILFGGLDGVRFKKLVVPGDKIEFKIEMIKLRSRIGKASFEAKVDGELACSGEIIFTAM